MKKFLIVALFLTVLASADSITVDGQVYSDVLVYETSRSYYVCQPDRGSVFRVSADAVDSSTVTIVRDAVYRSEMRAKYEKARGGDGAPAAAPMQRSNEPVMITGSADGGRRSTQKPAEDSSAVAAGASAESGSEGLGISLVELQASVQATGMQFGEAGPGQWSATAQGGKMTITAMGTEENLSQVEVQAAGTMAEIVNIVGGINQSFSSVAPWMGDWLEQEGPKLIAGGTIQEERDGVRVALEVATEGMNVQVRATVTAI